MFVPLHTLFITERLRDSKIEKYTQAILFALLYYYLDDRSLTRAQGCIETIDGSIACRSARGV